MPLPHRRPPREKQTRVPETITITPLGRSDTYKCQHKVIFHGKSWTYIVRCDDPYIWMPAAIDVWVKDESGVVRARGEGFSDYCSTLRLYHWGSLSLERS